MKQQFILLILLISSYTMSGQSQDNESTYLGGELGLSIGLLTYQGDLVKPNLDLGISSLSIGLNYAKHINDKLNLRAGFLFGSIKGDDADYDGRKNRGFKLEKTSIYTFDFSVDYFAYGLNKYDSSEKNFAFFVNAGLGMVFFNPEPTGINEAIEDSFSNTAIGIQAGGGVKYYMNDKISLGLELIFHQTFTDYLDGVSKNGNPDKNDTFFNMGLTVGYHL